MNAPFIRIGYKWVQGYANSRRLLLAATIMAVLIGGYRLSGKSSCPRDLAAIASPVGQAANKLGMYFWVSSHKLAFIEEYQKQMHIRVNVLDLATGQETPLPLISPALTSDIGPTEWRVSPDKKWLLWPRGRPEQGNWVVSDLSGRHVQQWLAAWNSSLVNPPMAAWLRDSHHWAEVTVNPQGTYIRILSIDNPKVIKRLLISKASFLGDIVGISAANEIIITLAPFQKDTVLLHITLGRTPKMHKFRVRLPPGGSNGQITLSPAGDTLSWVIGFSPVHGERQGRKESLYTSDLTGGNMHEVGCVSDASNGNDPDQSISAVGWLPDGKHLSFRYLHSLWSVPIS